MSHTPTIKRPTCIARQGDVYLIALPTNPGGGTSVPAAPDGSTVLAHGEVTGHRHRFEAGSPTTLRQTSEMGAERLLLDIGSGGAMLLHEEHGPIPMAARTVEVRIKHEYDPSVYGGSRRVED